MQHIYGYLWTVLLGKFLNVAVMNVRGWSVQSFESSLQPGDLVVGYPGAWQRWGDVKWPEGICGVSSGGGMVETLAASLLRNGLARWSEIYGCTELGAVGVREGLSSDFELAPYWPDRLAGISVPDALEWRDERHFSLGGRLDGLQEIRGMLVDFAKLRTILLEMKGVHDVVLRKREDRVEAMLVGNMEEAGVRIFLEARLPTWERPKRFWICEELPVDVSGKPLFNLETSIDV